MGLGADASLINLWREGGGSIAAFCFPPGEIREAAAPRPTPPPSLTIVGLRTIRETAVVLYTHQSMTLLYNLAVVFRRYSVDATVEGWGAVGSEGRVTLWCHHGSLEGDDFDRYR